MGSQSVKAIKSLRERKKFVFHLLNDVKTLELMIRENAFEQQVQRVGIEQELCVTTRLFRPSLNALKILEKINDPHFTTELALFNLEINLDPVELKENAFAEIEKELTNLIEKAHSAADEVENNKILLTGILPTLKKKDLIFENMTPHERYRILNDILKNLRGEEFKMRIRGVDELIIKHDSILFEACNTSFQVHLQISLDEIVDKYNWAQAIAGPVLSVMCNSPMLMGRELWCETRIALFQQSVDMRNTSYLLREQKPRVSFGNDWIRKSILELYTDDISRYTPLVTENIIENSLAEYQRGIMPRLRALNIHNGTLYKWNRLCYGVNKETNKAHLRIENRYIPSGPSIKDEVANTLFWVGVMQGMPDEYKEIWKKMPFKDARGNFVNAARTGINTYFNWFDKGISAKKLAKTVLIPMARTGLKKSNIDAGDIDYYLNIIEKRIENNITGSKWLIRSSRNLRKDFSNDQANILLTNAMYKYQQSNQPVYQWKTATKSKSYTFTAEDKLYKVMTTELFVVNEHDLIEMVEKIMEWKNIHHVPVVNAANKISGIITDNTLRRYEHLKYTEKLIVAKDIMEKKVITTSPEVLIKDAEKIMIDKEIGCLPVIDEGELIGIITKNDIIRLFKRTKK
ncbi:MAG: CBS domain-containing protein [Flavobacteriaceae bacterium]|nr:CBS domain-containing protein [Flavobacteriaceae bacterium]